MIPTTLRFTWHHASCTTALNFLLSMLACSICISNFYAVTNPFSNCFTTELPNTAMSCSIVGFDIPAPIKFQDNIAIRFTWIFPIGSFKASWVILDPKLAGLHKVPPMQRIQIWHPLLLKHLNRKQGRWWTRYDKGFSLPSEFTLKKLQGHLIGQVQNSSRAQPIIL